MVELYQRSRIIIFIRKFTSVLLKICLIGWNTLMVFLLIFAIVYGIASPLLFLGDKIDLSVISLANVCVIFSLSYWIFCRFSKIKKFYFRVPVYLTLLLITIFPLNYYSLKNNRLELSSAIQVEGYGMRGINILLVNDIGQRALGFVYNVLPATLSYLLRFADESLFLMDLNMALDDSSKCKSLPIDCANQIFSSLSKESRTSTFYILGTALKAKLLFKEKEGLKPNDNRGKYLVTKKLLNFTIDTVKRSSVSQYNSLFFEAEILARFYEVSLEKIDKLVTKASDKCAKENCTVDLSSERKEIASLKRSTSSAKL